MSFHYFGPQKKSVFDVTESNYQVDMREQVVLVCWTP